MNTHNPVALTQFDFYFMLRFIQFPKIHENQSDKAIIKKVNLNICVLAAVLCCLIHQPTLKSSCKILMLFWKPQ